MIELLLTTLVPALLPAVADGVRGVVAKITGSAGANPQNVDEQVSLMQANTERLKALADLDKPAGEISQWVADLRGSARYIATFAVILNGIVQSAIGSDPETVALSFQLAQGGFFYLFGDRVYINMKKAA